MSFNGDTTFLSGQLRVAALSVALLDFLQVIPAEIKLYRQGNKVKTALFVLTRYIGALALLCNALLYFRPTGEDDCRKIHLLGPVTQFIAGASSQAVFFYQTFTTSQRSRNVLGTLGFLMILIPVEGLTMILFRQSFIYDNDTTKALGCASIVPENKFNAGPIFYLAHLGFDVFAVVLCGWHVHLKQNCANKRSFLARFYNSGAVFMLVDFAVNLLTFLASLGVSGISPLGSMFAIVAAMSMAQHILLLEDGTETISSAEEKHHQILPSSGTPFQSVHSVPTMPGFPAGHGFIQRAQTMPISHQSQSSFDAGLHCARGREALKFRAEGDTGMFYRIPTDTKSAQSSTSNLVQPHANVRPISADSRRELIRGEAV